MSHERKMDRFNRWPLRFFVLKKSMPEGSVHARHEGRTGSLKEIDFFEDNNTNASGTGNGMPTQNAQVDLDLMVKHAKNLLSQRIISTVAPDGSASEPPPLCHPKTRVELLALIANWFGDPTREELLLWLTGPGGAGKSAVVQTFAEYLAEIKCLGASVFIPRTNKRKDPLRIFITIAYQLSNRIEEYRDFIAKRLSHDPELPNRGMREQFEAFIFEPFHKRSIGRGGKRWGIVLDGLDELQGESAQCEIIQLITTFISAHRDAPLVWIIASRPEPHISSAFSGILDQSYWLAHVPTDSTEACETAERFLRSSFEKMRRKRGNSIPKNWPSYTEFLKLTTAASYVPAYAEVAMRFIKGPVRADPIHADPIQVDPALGDPAQVHLVLGGSIHADPIQVDPAQVEPSPSDSAQADSAQVDLAQGDSIHADPIQVNLVQGDSTHADPALGDPATRLKYLLSLSDTLPEEDNPFANLDAIYKAILPSPDSAEWSSAKQLLSYCIHAENICFGEYRLPHSFQTLRGIAIVLNFSQIIHPCLLKCYSTVKASDAKAAHKKRLDFLHISFSEYLQDPRRSGKFYVGKAEDIKHDIALCVLQIWNKWSGVGATGWHRHCSKKGDKTSSLSISKFHATFFRDVVTFLRSIMYYTLCQCRGKGDPVYDEFCNVHMIKLCYSFDAHDLWGFVDTLLDQTSGVNDCGLLRKIELKELKFEHLNLKEMSPACAHYTRRRNFNTQWVTHRPRSKVELQKCKSKLESLQERSPNLEVVIFGGVPKGRVAAFQHISQDGPHRHLIPYPE